MPTSHPWKPPFVGRQENDPCEPGRERPTPTAFRSLSMPASSASAAYKTGLTFSSSDYVANLEPQMICVLI